MALRGGSHFPKSVEKTAIWARLDRLRPSEGNRRHARPFAMQGGAGYERSGVREVST